jgi:muramoyltetrapeptide carboxypeptidase
MSGCLVRPRSAPRGSTVGVCAPAGPVDAEVVAAGIGWLEDEGYQVRCAPGLKSRNGYLAGSDEERCADLMGLLRDPEVRAVFAARGGYGAARFLRALDPREVREARTAFVGYSDATALQLFLREQAGLASIHGPMLERSDAAPAARRRLLALLRGDPEALDPIEGEGLVGGTATGPLVGGNLKVVVASLGTPWEIDTRGAILFLEDVNEPPYAIDRTLVQLREAGKLAPLAGVALGQLVCCESDRYPEVGARDVFQDVLLPEVSGPVVVDLPFGHVADHRALGVGIRGRIDGDRGTLALVEPVVEDTELEGVD